jgi:cation:H+ antiporter
VGNIFGSNAFNMCVLLFMDLAYAGGPVLSVVSKDHMTSAQLAALCVSLGVLAVLSKLERRTAVARFESLLILACYGMGIWLLAQA